MILFKHASNAALWLVATCLIVSVAGCSDEAKSPKQTTGIDGGEATETPVGADGAKEDGGVGASDADRSKGKEAGAVKVNPGANEPLWEASAQGDLEGVKKALEDGASVHARNSVGNTALMLAVYDGHVDVAKLLIEKGSHVNVVNDGGQTPLMFAATFNSPKTVQLLLDHNAVVDARDYGERFTPLMHAAAEGHTDVVRVLLKYKADKSLVDIDGESAADFARSKGYSAIVKLLE